MQRRDLLHVLLAALALAGSGAGLAAPPEGPLRIACVGDSITWGAGIAGRERNSYPAQLAAILGPGATVGNFGFNGATLLRKGDTPYWGLAEYSAAQAFAPDVVVIQLGTNDSKPGNWMHSEDYVGDYVALVRSFQRLGSKPEVWVAYPVPAWSGEWGIRNQVVRDEILPMVSEVARQTGARTIDLNAALSGRGDRFPDGIHPDAEGARLIAAQVAISLAAGRAGALGSPPPTLQKDRRP